MCRLQNIALHYYQQSVTIGQTLDKDPYVPPYTKVF